MKALWLVLLASTPDGGVPISLIDGEWLTADRETKVRITCETSCTGTISWIAKPLEADGGVVRDTENPDVALRVRPIVGLVILNGLTKDSSTKWVNGTLYDPTDGATYRGSVTVKGPKSIELRGYVGIPLFGRSETWTRVE